MANYNDLVNARPTKVGFQIPQAPMVPANGLNDGIATTGLVVAPYLPLIRYNDDKFTHVVIGTGKPVALDSRGNVVPAGLRLDTTGIVKYTQLDVDNGVRNAKGDLVTAGEAVTASFADAGIEVGPHIGVVPYDVFRHAGGDNINPTSLNYINFNPQPVITVLRDYHMQYPVVATAEKVRQAALKGISALIATESQIKFGGFVTYDAESNFVIDDNPSFAGTVGQITGLQKFKDSTTEEVVGNHNLLNRVVAPNAATQSVLNQVANVSNDGMGSYITYSGGWAVAHIGLINR